jgi:maltooligosyltrehalose trehalohydrolase
MHYWQPMLGAVIQNDGSCHFCVWSPFAKQVELHLTGEQDRYISMEPDEWGYYTVSLNQVTPGQRYCYRLDGAQEYADPASYRQPEGVFGPSEVVKRQYDWQDDNWRGVPLQEYIIYELHIGTFSSEGTFKGAIPYLDELVRLGITAIELMPVNQFSGTRGWGYDGVFLFATQHSYGTPPEFKAFVDACHQHGIAVILDVVYNHFGPEGNCTGCFGPYTTDHYKTPWGDAINLDGPHSDEVRAFFIENAHYWIDEFHIDALRLDATHFIFDNSAYTFMEELIAKIGDHRERLNRKIYLIAENDLNDPSLTRARDLGGYGIDAQWNDDFHHSMHTLLTNETYEYYAGFGELEHLVKAFREGFVYSGQYSPFRKHRHGRSSSMLPAEKFVVFTQNHDQIGNRMPSQRMCQYISFAALKLAAGVIIVSSNIPMIFMGEEYHEDALFNFFTDFQEEELVQAIREGRKMEFGSLLPEGDEPPDPQAEDSFLQSKLKHDLKASGKNRTMFDFHKKLFELRKSLLPLYDLHKEQMDVLGYERECLLYLRRWSGDEQVFMAFNFNHSPSTVTLPVPAGIWNKHLNSADPCWRDDIPAGIITSEDTLHSNGQLKLTVAPQSFVLYQRLS